MDFLLPSAAPEKSPLRREERQGENGSVEKALRGEKSSVEGTAKETGAPESCLLGEQISGVGPGIPSDSCNFEMPPRKAWLP